MMTIKFAKYAFKDLLKQLHYSGINEITITKEDNDLEIVISDKYLEPYKVELTNNTQKGCVVEMDSNGFPKYGVITATSYNKIDPKNVAEFN